MKEHFLKNLYARQLIARNKNEEPRFNRGGNLNLGRVFAISWWTPSTGVGFKSSCSALARCEEESGPRGGDACSRSALSCLPRSSHCKCAT